jgi:penicillin amidase
MRVHRAGDPPYPMIPFERLPHIAPSETAVAFTANNRMYGRDYRLRLSPFFEPPYRAARIAQLLRERSEYDVEYFSAMQRDTVSLMERELAGMFVQAVHRKHLANDPKLAPLVDELAHWDGSLDPDSHGATLANAARIAAQMQFVYSFFGKTDAADAYHHSSDDIVVMMRALRERPKGFFRSDDADEFLVDALRSVAGALQKPWREAGSVPIRHPLVLLGINWFNGVTLPGDGDGYSVHVQVQQHGQSFRAVWDAGNWDAGGIVIPSGESGRPGSEYYTDLSATWIAQKLEPLPFTDAAVNAAARHHLTLKP